MKTIILFTIVWCIVRISKLIEFYKSRPENPNGNAFENKPINQWMYPAWIRVTIRERTSVSNIQRADRQSRWPPVPLLSIKRPLCPPWTDGGQRWMWTKRKVHLTDNNLSSVLHVEGGERNEEWMSTAGSDGWQGSPIKDGPGSQRSLLSHQWNTHTHTHAHKHTHARTHAHTHTHACALPAL